MQNSVRDRSQKEKKTCFSTDYQQSTVIKKAFENMILWKTYNDNWKRLLSGVTSRYTEYPAKSDIYISANNIANPRSKNLKF